MIRTTARWIPAALVWMLLWPADAGSQSAALTEAEPLYHRSLAIWGKALGPQHPQAAMSRNNLAALYRAQGKAVRFSAEGEAIEEIHRGVTLVSLPPNSAVRYDITLIDQREALANVRKALDLIYQKSPFNAATLETLKKGDYKPCKHGLNPLYMYQGVTRHEHSEPTALSR